MKGLTTAELKKFAKIALKARNAAYSPYSDHPVGAVVVSSSGKAYAGTNVEAANYKGICGEGAAISAMVLAGEKKIKAVIVAGPTMEYLCTPCGDCRQRIREFADGETVIYSLWKDGTFGKVNTLEELLPYSFGPDNMAERGKGPNKNEKTKKKKRK